MADRYAQDIKRIVGVDPTQSQLEEAKAKEKIKGKRGISYLAPDGKTAQTISGDSAVTTVSNADPSSTDLGAVEPSSDVGERDSDAEVTATGGAGMSVDPNNPLRSTYTEDMGSYKAEDIIDQTDKFPSISSDVQSGVGALQDRQGGTLMSLSDAVDCATGNSIDIRLDGLFIPPTGWADADTPPPLDADETWESGKAWRRMSAVACTLEGGSSYPTLAAAISGEFATGTVNSITYYSVPNYPGCPTADGAVVNLDVPPFSGINRGFEKYGCTLGGTGCPIEDPTGQSDVTWDSDSQMQLALSDGKFVSSSREHPDDVIPEYTDNQHSRIDFCFGAGNSRTGTIEVTRDGGIALYETSGGSPTGVVTIFGVDRKVKAYTDAAGLSAYLPIPAS